MNTSVIVTATELTKMYQDGEKRGFVTGVIATVAGYALIRKMRQAADRANDNAPFASN